ncbi:MAG: WS/DGAT/MGAT family O-acyltransferase [Solirubrobacterales bacterium]
MPSGSRDRDRPILTDRSKMEELTTPHMDRLTGLDASFLTNENEASHMHIGAVLIFDGEPPAYRDFLAHVESRLPLVPRYRQKLAYPPMDIGRPLWVDDDAFNLAFHMRHTALPSPGTERELITLANRVFSQSLDREKPLWEMYLVEVLEGDRFAVLIKSHHAMIDGVSGVDIGTVIFDLTPDPEPVERVEPWEPRRSPSEYALLGQSAGVVAGAPLRLSARALDAVRNPQQIAAKIGEGIEGLAEIAKQFADPAPDVPLNTEITPHRRIAITRASLEDLKTVKNHYDTTVNDVVLATVTGSLRNWLINRGVDVDGLELRALVPVSVRAEDEHGALGNRLAAMRGLLPVYESDPVRRLEIVSAAMDGLKESKQALGAEVIARLNDFAPPTLLAQSGRLNFSTRLFNLLVTNVPGPQIPLYMLGREMSEVFPIPFLAENHGLAVAVISYNGKVDFGLLGDFDAMPDIEMVSEGLNEALAELVATCSED